MLLISITLAVLLSPLANAKDQPKPTIDKRVFANKKVVPNQTLPDSAIQVSKQLQGAFKNPTDETFSNYTYPRFTGEKTFSVDIKFGQGSFMPASAENLKVKLFYRVGNSRSQNSRGLPQTNTIYKTVIAKVESIPNSTFTYRATAILPLPSENQLPIKLLAGQQIEYRWAVESTNNADRLQSAENSLVMPRPYTIAIMGDSFGAGEGAPNEIKPNDVLPADSTDVENLVGEAYINENNWDDFADWSDRKSHRSDNSGLLKGVEKFESDNPHLWIEYIHTAISSATISQWNQDHADIVSGGMLGNFKGGREIVPSVHTVSGLAQAIPNGGLDLIPKEKNQQEPQLNIVEQWLTDTGLGCLDTVVMSAGGNDMEFGKLIITAILSDLDPTGISGPVNASGWMYANKIIGEGIERANPHVDFLFEALKPVANPSRVFWVNYPNLTNPMNGTRWHEQTLWLGGEIAAVRITASALGSAVGAIIFPIPGPHLVLTEIAAQLAANQVLEAKNLNTTVFALSLGIGVIDMVGINQIIKNRLNPQIDIWCEKEGHADICEVINIDNARILTGHGLGGRGLGGQRVNHRQSSERYFNTFIDSYQFACGGLDCAIHPNEKGFEQLYVAKVVSKLTEDYRQLIETEQETGARICEVKSNKDLEVLHVERQRIVEEGGLLGGKPYYPPTPPPPSEKEIADIAAALETNLGGDEYGRRAREAFELYIKNARKSVNQ